MWEASTILDPDRKKTERSSRRVRAGLMLAWLVCWVGCAVRWGEDGGKLGEAAMDFPNALDVAVADFDKDGQMDYVIGYVESVFLYAGRPTGGEVYKQRVCAVRAVSKDGNLQRTNLHLKSVDLDRDGDEDLIVSDLDGGRVFWNDGRGELSPSRLDGEAGIP